MSIWQKRKQSTKKWRKLGFCPYSSSWKYRVIVLLLELALSTIMITSDNPPHTHTPLPHQEKKKKKQRWSLVAGPGPNFPLAWKHRQYLTACVHRWAIVSTGIKMSWHYCLTGSRMVLGRQNLCPPPSEKQVIWCVKDSLVAWTWQDLHSGNTKCHCKWPMCFLPRGRESWGGKLTQHLQVGWLLLSFV